MKQQVFLLMLPDQDALALVLSIPVPGSAFSGYCSLL